MYRFKSIAMILVVTILCMSMTPATAEAKKPWWKIVGGLLATGGAVAAGLTGAGAAVVVPLCGVETGLLGTAAGGGSNNGGGVPGGIHDAQPAFSGPSLPEFCPGGDDDCDAIAAIRQAHLRALPLPGTSPTVDSLTAAVNTFMTNPLKDHMLDGSGLDIVQADMRAAADQLDEIADWLDILEVEDSSTRVVFTPQLIEQARQWMAVNGLPAEEVDIYLDAGLTMDQIDAIAAFHVEAMADIDLLEPVTMQEVLRDAAADFRAMGSAATPVDHKTPDTVFSLQQNSPNPFNPMTVISYTVHKSGPLSVKIYDVRGQVVKTLVDGHASAGDASITWSGNDDRGGKVPSGTYFCRVQGAGQQTTMKMTLMK